MRRIDFGLLLALCILISLAVFSPKKILIAEAYVISEPEFARGAEVYARFCSRCHEDGRNGAPALNDAQEWELRLAKGIDRLIVACDRCCAGENGSLAKGTDFTLAAAYMIAVSQGKAGKYRR